MEGFDIASLTNYGALGLCLAYFMWRDAALSSKLKQAIDSLEKTLIVIREKVDACGERKGV